jgi:methylthioribose-1-phosphate isomerase
MPFPHLKSVRWRGGPEGDLVVLDQRLLPRREANLRCLTVRQVAHAIRTMAVRGAPLIGVTAAYGMVLAAREGDPRRGAAILLASRPTAVNLRWAVERMLPHALRGPKDALRAARAIHAEDAESCDRIGRSGARLVGRGAKIMTICNTGALATAGIGTAFAVFVHARPRRPTIYALETRPRLQGARLTMFELRKARLQGKLVCDGAAGAVMSREGIDLVIAGADRIAANGDAANKIGTYMLAVMAKERRIPFYVAAPASTFDIRCRSGRDIPIEERPADEVLGPLGLKGLEVLNPAFDVTPARLITGFITDRGLLRPPFPKSIAAAIGPKGQSAVDDSL